VRTSLSNATSIPRGLFVEAILTVELVFTILMLAKEKHKSTFMAPVGIGLALFVAELVGVQWTGGYESNPSRM
jgi:aquaporin related protein